MEKSEGQTILTLLESVSDCVSEMDTTWTSIFPAWNLPLKIGLGSTLDYRLNWKPGLNVSFQVKVPGVVTVRFIGPVRKWTFV